MCSAMNGSALAWARDGTSRQASGGLPPLVGANVRAASAAVRWMRAWRVVLVLALVIHSRMARRADRGKAFQYRRAPGVASRAAARSAGSVSVSASSRAVHAPLALAATTAARPAGCMRPSLVSCSTRALLRADQLLPGLRGVRRRAERCSSTRKVDRLSCVRFGSLASWTWRAAREGVWSSGRSAPFPLALSAPAALRRSAGDRCASGGASAGSRWPAGGSRHAGLPPRTPAPGPVPLTEVHTCGQDWWSLGFEATGPGDLLRSELEASAALVFAEGLPSGVELGQDDSRSYAEWLCQRPGGKNDV